MRSVSFRIHMKVSSDFTQADLEASVPSSTVTSSSHTTPQSVQTRNHARSLRVKLEELDALHRDRIQLVHQASALEAADDIQPRILKVASGFERLAELKAEMFEDILDEEILKYDRFLSEMGSFRQKQEAILADIKVGVICQMDHFKLKINATQSGYQRAISSIEERGSFSQGTRACAPIP